MQGLLLEISMTYWIGSYNFQNLLQKWKQQLPSSSLSANIKIWKQTKNNKHTKNTPPTFKDTFIEKTPLTTAPLLVRLSLFYQNIYHKEDLLLDFN